MQFWILASLASALGAALYGVAMKRALSHGGPLSSTAAFRCVSGLILLTWVLSRGSWPEPTAAYWKTLALILVPEVAGMVCMTLALRAGDLSLVQPLLGLIPLFVLGTGAVILGEVPSPVAGIGVFLVATGVYTLGLQKGKGVMEPLRALGRESASRYALGAVTFWSVATALHKHGIREVGAFPWAVSLTLASALLLILLMPLLSRWTGSEKRPLQSRAWAGWVTLAGALFAVEQAGLHSALLDAQASYVSAVKGSSVVLGVLLGVILLKERGSMRNRLAGGILITTGIVALALLA